MKKFLLLCAVVASLSTLKVLANDDKGNNANHPVREYVKEHVMPVVMQKRQEFDLKLNETERTELAAYRDELSELRKDMHQEWSRNFFSTDEETPAIKQERENTFNKIKDIMAQVRNIADRHSNDLDKIAGDIQPMREQWKGDITNLMAEQKALREANTNSTENATPSFSPDMAMHGGFGGFGHDLYNLASNHEREIFLLLNPSNVSLMNDERTAPYANIAPVLDDENVTIYPNPAAGEFSLNVAGVTNIDKMVITDMTGKMVSSQQDVSPTGTINCSNLSNGMYLVQLYANGQTLNRKLIVSR